MKFAHMADVHIGAWRDPKMKGLPILAFEQAVKSSIEQQVDFLIIAGDLFNSAVPPLDQVKRTVAVLQQLKEAGIPVYAIAGSHDYSPTGKTMLDVLEEAGLMQNVMKGEIVEGKLRLTFTTDPKTGVKLTGILGRAQSLDRTYYQDLDRKHVEEESGEKIFLFHASLAELKPKRLEHMEAAPVSTLPRECNYYAGGHVHIQNETTLPGYRQIVYPGPVYPASFSELEELGTGSFCIVEDWQMTRVPVQVKEHLSFQVDATRKTPVEVNAALKGLEKEEVQGKIILLRISGELKEGRASDVNTKELFRAWYESGAFFVMKNTMKLTSKEFESYEVSHQNSDEVEAKIIKEHVGQQPINKLSPAAERELTQELLRILGEEQHETEKKYEYEERIIKAGKELLTKN